MDASFEMEASKARAEQAEREIVTLKAELGRVRGERDSLRADLEAAKRELLYVSERVAAQEGGHE